MKQRLAGAEPPARIAMLIVDDLMEVHEVVAENVYARVMASFAATLDATAQDALEWLNTVSKRKGTKRGGKGC